MPRHIPAQEDDVIDLGALFGTLWRGKWIIVLLSLACMFAGGYYSFFVATPTYRSTAVVKLETQQEQIVDLQSVVGGLTGDSSEINSEVEVLRARGLMGKVVEQLDLIDDPEFNANLRPASTIDGLKEDLKQQLGIHDTDAQLPGPEQSQRTRDSVISSLLESVTIRNIPQSLVFQVTVETESASKSKLIADTITELYIVDQIAVKFEATEQATIWLSDRVTELGAELEAAEGELADFSASTELVSQESLQALERQIKESRERVETIGRNLNADRVEFTALQNAATRSEQAAIAEDSQLEQLLPRAENDEEIATLFDARFERILLRKGLDADRAKQQLAALQASVIDLQTQFEQQGQDMIKLQQMSRGTEATRLLYEYFLSRLKETSAQQGIQQADSRILSKAVIPNRAASPRKSLIVAVSTILGLMIGTGLVLLLEARKTGFRTARDLEVFSGYTVLGQIPLMPAKSRKKVLNYLSDKPTSAAAEAVRNLRTSVMLSNVDKTPQVIVSTSSIPGEGKTTTAIALAHNLIGLGKSVLLIEGDIRRRSLNEYFNSVPEKGIVSVLSGEITLEDATFRTAELKADVLTGEKTKINAADLFSSEKFKLFLVEARKRYDVIIIDTPPVLVVPDARIISQEADAVLFSVKWDSTSRSQIEEALRLFQSANSKVSGLVLGQISPKGMKKYGYGGRYGAYAGYGAKYYSN